MAPMAMPALAAVEMLEFEGDAGVTVLVELAKGPRQCY